MVKEYAEYLKDNPEGLWFKRKLYGWGWMPATWQGWAVIAAFILYIGIVGSYFAERAEAQALVNGDITAFVVKIVVCVAVLVYICYRKGEKPKWQWGTLTDRTTHY
ncbi:MAG: hypothetical protein JWN18_331 [Parcubacteria group bacterium]|nr:hypothetical protein [Parcubacteria group bacterium]